MRACPSPVEKMLIAVRQRSILSSYLETNIENFYPEQCQLRVLSCQSGLQRPSQWLQESKVNAFSASTQSTLKTHLHVHQRYCRHSLTVPTQLIPKLAMAPDLVLDGKTLPAGLAGLDRGTCPSRSA